MYSVSLTAYYASNVNASNTAVTTEVDITVGSSPLSAEFHSGTALTANLPLTMHVDATDPETSSDPFIYDCVIVGVSDNLDWTYTATTSSSSPDISVPQNAINADVEYWFNCSVSKSNRESVQISSRVFISSAIVPVVSITRASGKFKTNNALRFDGNASLGASQFQWSASPYVNFSSTVGGTSVNTRALSLLPHALMPGVDYTFTLQAWIEGESARGSATVLVKANQAPHSGSFTVAPSSGIITSLHDIVLFSVSGFEDDAADSPFMYQFEYEMHGKKHILRTFTEASTYTTSSLPVGSILPLVRVQDRHGTERTVFLGCDAFTLDGGWATDSSLCPATRVQVSPPAVGVNQTANQAVTELIRKFVPGSHSSNDVNNFAKVALTTAANTSASVLKAVLDM